MFKPAPLCGVRTLCTAFYWENCHLFAQVVTFQFFCIHVGDLSLHVDYYPSAFSVGDSFCTDNCNKFCFLKLFRLRCFFLGPLAVSLDKIKVTKLMQFSTVTSFVSLSCFVCDVFS